MFFSFCLIAGFIILFSLWYPRFLSEALMYVAQPLWSAKQFVADISDEFFAYLASKQALNDEIRVLRNSVISGEAELADRRLLLEENRKLKEILGRRVSERRILATILVLPPQSPYDSFVLDVGRDLGVAVGDEVLLENVVLGRIKKVFSRTSVAELLSNAGNKVDAVLIHEGYSIPLQAEGEGGGFLKAVLPREVEVVKGDLITLSGIHSRVVAKVEVIEDGTSDSFQTIYFKIPVSMTGLRFAEIRLTEATLPES